MLNSIKSENMKNNFFVVLISLMPFFLNAQEIKKTTQLGFTTTPNIAWMSSNGNSSFESAGSSSGFSYGIIADLGFSENYFFATGFTLTSLNSKATTETKESKYHLQYIEIPLTLKLKSNVSKIGRLYGQFGLGTGIKVKATEDYHTRGAATGASDGVNISKEVNLFRLGLIAGAGAEWKVANLNILTGVTYNNGFTNVIKESSRRNSYVALNLGVFF